MPGDRRSERRAQPPGSSAHRADHAELGEPRQGATRELCTCKWGAKLDQLGRLDEELLEQLLLLYSLGD